RLPYRQDRRPLRPDHIAAWYPPHFVFSNKILEFPPNFVISFIGTPSSRDKISTTFEPQKPPWHLPIPARVRRLTPSTSRAPAGAWIASRISPSVIVSQRQITLPYALFLAISASRSAFVILRK